MGQLASLIEARSVALDMDRQTGRPTAIESINLIAPKKLVVLLRSQHSSNDVTATVVNRAVVGR